MNSKPARRGGDRPEGYFPLAYYRDFLRLLKAHKHLIRVITYRDLCWNNDWDHAEHYPEEGAEWKRRLRHGTLDPKVIYVLLQHDVDSCPERAMQLLREEERLGLRSNVMIFNRRVNRAHLKATGEVVYTDYPLDRAYLRFLQDRHGFVIGYHCNALEQARFDLAESERVFEADVRALREDFDIEFFSPHGGAAGPGGANNHDLPIPDSLRQSLRWVANRYGPRFTGSYSDGGINSAQRNPARRDLRDFVRSWRPGGRYWVLTHPQYFAETCDRSPRLSGTPWYEEVLRSYAEGGGGGAWRDADQALARTGIAGVQSVMQRARHIIRPLDTLLRHARVSLRRKRARLAGPRPTAPGTVVGTGEECPVFVRGMSRSGGTLAVTILDSHPEIAMSYEIYPDLLELQDGSQAHLRAIAARVGAARTLKQAFKTLPPGSLRTFVSRCPRGGVDQRKFAEILVQHVEDGMSFESPEDRMRFMARCCRVKMHQTHKSRWGLKCSNRYEDYLRLWPRAYFINVIRDGRDVLASQLNTGAFRNSPAQVARSWAETHRKFRRLIADPGVRAFELRYEDLVADPAQVIRRLTGFLGLGFDPAMLDHDRQDLTIYQASHLSMDRISAPVDAARVGRWRRDLEPQQVLEFLQGAEGALAEFGYDERC